MKRRCIPIGLLLWPICVTLLGLQPANSAEINRFLCVQSNGGKAFQLTPERQCLKRPLEEGWVNLIFDKPILVDYHANSIVVDDDNIKVWMQTFFANPRQLTAGGKYDSLKAVYQFSCNANQQRLVQGTYAFGDRVVWERSSSQSILEEIEPGTLSEAWRNYFCKSLMRPATANSGERLPASKDALAQLNEAGLRFLFRCPESFSTEDEQKDEIERFLNWIVAHPHSDGKGWTVNDIGKLRMSLLTTHRCAQTLRNVNDR